MPGTHLQDDARIQAFVPSQSRKRYVVARREDVWFIVFNGADFGPYKTEREAKLFAIDAAFKLGEKGEESEVLVAAEAVMVAPVCVYGQNH